MRLNHTYFWPVANHVIQNEFGALISENFKFLVPVKKFMNSNYRARVDEPNVNCLNVTL